jgi:hypothetical protein
MFGFSSSKKSLSLSVFLGMIGGWWRRRSPIVFSILFFGVLGLGIFSWYQSLYLFRWSADEEREYRLSKDRQVRFQGDRFDSVVKNLDDRAELHRQFPVVFRDVFYGEKEISVEKKEAIVEPIEKSLE